MNRPVEATHPATPARIREAATANKLTLRI
jgi:hypothetical protein